jgi:hypothetical protein
MGTNFYLKKRIKEYEKTHIGKRSAAGLYCWKCNVTLCKNGKSKIHFSDNNDWFNKCPICGAQPIVEDLNTGAGSRELGFEANPPTHRPTEGVSSCSSFTWAVEPEFIYDLRDDTEIIDEYMREYYLQEFLYILRFQCPIRFYGLIGQEFS